MAIHGFDEAIVSSPAPPVHRWSPTTFTARSGVSRHGNGTALLLEFGLPKASYATVAIREVMKMAKSLGVGDLVGGLRS